MASSTTLLQSRVDLADAIVTAAREQRDEAAALPHTPSSVSLYEGCCASYEARKREAEELRGQLIRALRDEHDALVSEAGVEEVAA